MNKVRWLLSTLIVSVLISAFVSFYLQPTASLPEATSYGYVLIVELVALIISGILVGDSRMRTPLKIIVFSFLFALVITFILVPSNRFGVENTFLAVLFIEFAGFSLGSLLIRDRPINTSG